VEMYRKTMLTAEALAALTAAGRGVPLTPEADGLTTRQQRRAAARRAEKSAKSALKVYHTRGI
jgi:hypothetical protein